MIRILKITVAVFTLLFFSGCGLFDEMKGLSVYSDFIFAFQDYWELNASGLPVTPAGEGDIPGSVIYEIEITPEAPVTGALKNAYSGAVRIVFFTVNDSKGVEQQYFEIEADLNVVSQAKTVVGQVTDVEISATCKSIGLVLDGYCFVRNNSSATVAIYTQIANLEGLWIFIKDPSAIAPAA